MTIINVKNNFLINESNIGALICHTPKNKVEYDLIKSTDELEEKFGDPFIDPSLYADLVLAYDLIRRGVPMYISSVYDMYNNTDGFDSIHYNGYTEFYFIENGFEVVGYKLKHEMKFIQPIIQTIELTDESHRLHLYVNLYYLDRFTKKEISDINLLHSSRLYNTIEFVFDANSVTDEDIIRDFKSNGFELKILYSGNNNRTLASELIKKANNDKLSILLRSTSESEITIYRDSNFIYTDDYRYNIHTSDYMYDFDEETVTLSSYMKAIDRLSNLSVEPLMLCMGRMIKLQPHITDDILTGFSTTQLESESQIAIYNHLLDAFNEDCNTYLFINAPDLTVSSTIQLLSQSGKFREALQLNSNFNCDLFYGYATDFVDCSLVDSHNRKVEYSAALLSFYNLMITSSAYITNNFIDLNISNDSVKLVLTESSASKLKDLKCNSMVLFDIGSPSVYGDRSLSNLPNLRFSHVSRNFVRLRKLIRDYLDTKKFILNTMFNIDSCVDNIKFNILDDFKSHGIISDYDISYTINYQTVNINVILLFSRVAESIAIDFVI
jgi:hypothetical protein